MISICVPVYNFDLTLLLNELTNQAKSLEVPFEIIVIDDCSQNFKEINKKLCEAFNYIELEENIGRARIRNLFLNYAKYDYLLFLDCDSLIGDSDFLTKYVECIDKGPSIVCGGRVYDKNLPKRDRILNWKYGILRESQAFELRQKFPNKSFMTNNFLINKKVLEEIRFDERITKYGHEDTLFGFALKKKNIQIIHIDNPVINGDLEKNGDFLKKTKEGVINLIHILKFKEYDKELINDISILKFYNSLSKTAEKLIQFSFILFKPLIVFLLSKGYVSLFLFDYYKLGIFIENRRKDQPTSIS